MSTRDLPTMTWEEALAVLGVGPEAGEAEARAAYLEKVRRHPPDRDPEAFERVRDAYEHLKDPRRRAHAVLSGPDPTGPPAAVLDGVRLERQFVGARMWIDTLKELKEKRP